MALTIATWNINSVRLRAELVAEFLKREAPDILCLQETKSPVEKMLPEKSERNLPAGVGQAGKRMCHQQI